MKEALMAENHPNNKTPETVSAQPDFHQRAAKIQVYGAVNHFLPLELEEPVRLEMTAQLNQLLADTMTLRDLYKKSHWQVAGPTLSGRRHPSRRARPGACLALSHQRVRRCTATSPIRWATSG